MPELTPDQLEQLARQAYIEQIDEGRAALFRGDLSFAELDDKDVDDINDAWNACKKFRSLYVRQAGRVKSAETSDEREREMLRLLSMFKVCFSLGFLVARDEDV